MRLLGMKGNQGAYEQSKVAVSRRSEILSPSGDYTGDGRERRERLHCEGEEIQLKCSSVCGFADLLRKKPKITKRTKLNPLKSAKWRVKDLSFCGSCDQGRYVSVHRSRAAGRTVDMCLHPLLLACTVMSYSTWCLRQRYFMRCGSIWRSAAAAVFLPLVRRSAALK